MVLANLIMLLTLALTATQTVKAFQAMYASGDIADTSVTVNKAATGDQRLVINNNSKNIALSTEISGLKAGTDYVARILCGKREQCKD